MPPVCITHIVKGTDVELPVLLAAWLSLRIGEVIGLKFKDVDTVTHEINVRRTIIKTKDGYKVREGCKTEKSKRQLELPNNIYDTLFCRINQYNLRGCLPSTDHQQKKQLVCFSLQDLHRPHQLKVTAQKRYTYQVYLFFKKPHNNHISSLHLFS